MIIVASRLCCLCWCAQIDWDLVLLMEPPTLIGAIAGQQHALGQPTEPTARCTLCRRPVARQRSLSTDALDLSRSCLRDRFPCLQQHFANAGHIGTATHTNCPQRTSLVLTCCTVSYIPFVWCMCVPSPRLLHQQNPASLDHQCAAGAAAGPDDDQSRATRCTHL